MCYHVKSSSSFVGKRCFMCYHVKSSSFVGKAFLFVALFYSFYTGTLTRGSIWFFIFHFITSGVRSDQRGLRAVTSGGLCVCEVVVWLCFVCFVLFFVKAGVDALFPNGGVQSPPEKFVCDKCGILHCLLLVQQRYMCVCAEIYVKKDRQRLSSFERQLLPYFAAPGTRVQQVSVVIPCTCWVGLFNSKIFSRFFRETTQKHARHTHTTRSKFKLDSVAAEVFFFPDNVDPQWIDDEREKYNEACKMYHACTAGAKVEWSATSDGEEWFCLISCYAAVIFYGERRRCCCCCMKPSVSPRPTPLAEYSCFAWSSWRLITHATKKTSVTALHCYYRKPCSKGFWN